ncbi:hypothetical protein [uncultured Roseobacter sp.]|uniref:hypothetical protein n=1 Tax=uncultured Roseobacter sp. TaxID=114847 RepID=UPI002614FAD9|nr:hypothetical protein [uncultured Roseobacter sp.]
MNETIGTRLGGLLAGFEESLMQNGCPPETLSTIAQISEIYCNLATGDLAGFREDFDHGYQETKRGIEEDYSLATPEKPLGYPDPHNG